MNETVPTPEPDKLGDRIVEFLAGETAKNRTKWAAKGENPEYYAAAFPVADLAAALGVVPDAINGALGPLHQSRQVIGICIAAGATGGAGYLIALRRDLAPKAAV